MIYHIHTYICVCPPDLLLAMMIAVTIRTNEMVNTKVMEEAIATGTTMLFASIGTWLYVAGI